MDPALLSSDYHNDQRRRLELKQKYACHKSPLRAAVKDYVILWAPYFFKKTLKKLICKQSIDNTYMEGALHFLAACGILYRAKGSRDNVPIYYTPENNKATKVIYSHYLERIEPPRNP